MKRASIPILDLSDEISALWDELQVAIQNVLRSGQFIMGPNVTAFEAEVESYLGVKHAVAMNSGTDALYIALRALGVSAGDEVITTPFTFFATAEAISHVGATPVFVDIDPVTYNIDPALIESAITPHTKAIIPVHLFGHPADMDPILEVAARHGLKVIEDVAQAFGAEYKGRKAGTLGHAGTFSFFPTKNLGAYGDGGLLATDDDEVAELARKLRAHGSLHKYQNELVGYNSRLDELQAAILRVKLPHVDEWNLGRRRVAETYRHLLRDLPGIVLPTEQPGVRHVYHQFTLRVLGGRRAELKDRLEKAGIGTMVYYPIPVHRLPVYGQAANSFPVAEVASAQVLSLPIWAQLGEHLQCEVVERLRLSLAR